MTETNAIAQSDVSAERERVQLNVRVARETRQLLAAYAKTNPGSVESQVETLLLSHPRVRRFVEKRAAA